jgi:hypothetical protein
MRQRGLKKNSQVQMQLNFSLNNFDVSPSASNSGDGVSEVVLSCLIKGEKKQKNKKHNKAF